MLCSCIFTEKLHWLIIPWLNGGIVQTYEMTIHDSEYFLARKTIIHSTSISVGGGRCITEILPCGGLCPRAGGDAEGTAGLLTRPPRKRTTSIYRGSIRCTWKMRKRISTMQFYQHKFKLLCKIFIWKISVMF